MLGLKDARIEAGNLELSEWIWQNVEKRCSAAWLKKDI
jgi:hypothetical protein